jgi:hypothetical protein
LNSLNKTILCSPEACIIWFYLTRSINLILNYTHSISSINNIVILISTHVPLLSFSNKLATTANLLTKLMLTQLCNLSVVMTLYCSQNVKWHDVAIWWSWKISNLLKMVNHTFINANARRGSELRSKWMISHVTSQDYGIEKISKLTYMNPIS